MSEIEWQEKRRIKAERLINLMREGETFMSDCIIKDNKVHWDKPQTWTRDPPTEPGWYWLLDGTVTIVELVAGPDELWVYYPGVLINDPVSRFTKNYWLGPLAVPQPPEDKP